MITLFYRGKEYEVADRAYDDNCLIVLPNGTVLEVGIWYESMPPQPGDIREVKTQIPFVGKPEDLASLLHGILATEK